MKSSELQESVIERMKENANKHIWHLDLLELTPKPDDLNPQDLRYNYKMLKCCGETMQSLIDPFFNAKVGFSRVGTCIVFEEVILPSTQNNNPDFVNDVCAHIVKSRADKLDKIAGQISERIHNRRYSYSNSMFSLLIINEKTTDRLTDMEQKELKTQLEAIGLKEVTCNSDVYDGIRPKMNCYHNIQFKATEPLKTDKGNRKVREIAITVNAAQPQNRSLSRLVMQELLRKPQGVMVACS